MTNTYLEQKLETLSAHVLRLEQYIARLDSEMTAFRNKATFIPIKQVVLEKRLPKCERTIRQWVKSKAKLGYHYQYCGKTLMIEVDRFNRLLNGYEI